MAKISPSTIRIGKRYRSTRLDGPYDALVIGSGMGGLTTAACLSKMGKKVAVLEQHYTAGGFTHSYERAGYEWDVGIHYIGDVGSKHTLSRRIFDFITARQLKWAPMGKHFDRIFLGDQHYDLVAGKKPYRRALVNAFPDQEAAIDQYLEYMRKTKDAVRSSTMERLLPGWLAALKRRWRQSRQPWYVNAPTRQVLESLTSNQELIAVMTGQWGDCGLPPAQSSFQIHTMIALHYMYGAYYPVGGGSRIAETVRPIIQAAGGEVFTYASVEQIVLQGGRAVGVKMADGHEIRAPLVISNAGVFNTFNKLLPSGTDEQAKLPTVQPSMASACLYIGLKHTAEDLGLPKTNFWIYPSADYEGDIERFMADPSQEIPLVYISFPSAKDPAFEEKYPGRSTIEIVAPGPMEWFEKWAGTQWGKRGEDYDALKEQISQRLLQALYQKLPQLEGKVDYYELSTALSTDYFCRYDQGEIYGLDHTPQRFDQTWLKPKTSIKGLYLTGQDILSCGVVGAMTAGVLTAVKVLGLRKGYGLLKQIMSF